MTYFLNMQIKLNSKDISIKKYLILFGAGTMLQHIRLIYVFINQLIQRIEKSRRV